MRRSRASPSTPLCCTWATSMRSASSAEGPAKKGFRESCSADMEDNLTLLTLDGTVNYVKTAALLRHTAALRGARRPRGERRVQLGRGDSMGHRVGRRYAIPSLILFSVAVVLAGAA